FQNVHGPTWLDRMKQRALELLERLLSRVVRPSDIPTITSLVMYGLMTLAVLLVVWSVFAPFDVPHRRRQLHPAVRRCQHENGLSGWPTRRLPPRAETGATRFTAP